MHVLHNSIEFSCAATTLLRLFLFACPRVFFFAPRALVSFYYIYLLFFLRLLRKRKTPERKKEKRTSAWLMRFRFWPRCALCVIRDDSAAFGRREKVAPSVDHVLSFSEQKTVVLFRGERFDRCQPAFDATQTGVEFEHRPARSHARKRETGAQKSGLVARSRG